MVRAVAVAAGCAAGGTHVLEDNLGFGERHRGVAIERQVGDALSELRVRLKAVGPQLRDLSERLDGGAAVVPDALFASIGRSTGCVIRATAASFARRPASPVA